MLCIKGGVQDYSFWHILKINSAIMIRWNHLLFFWATAENFVVIFLKKKSPNWSRNYSIRSFGTAPLGALDVEQEEGACTGRHYCTLRPKAAPPVFPHLQWKLFADNESPFPCTCFKVPKQGQPPLDLTHTGTWLDSWLRVRGLIKTFDISQF